MVVYMKLIFHKILTVVMGGAVGLGDIDGGNELVKLSSNHGRSCLRYTLR